MKMSSHRLFVAGLLLLTGMLPLTGCTTALKHAYYELRGAKGDIEFIQTPTAAELEACQGLRLSAVESTIGPKLCPPKLRVAYDRHARQLVSDLREEFPGGEPTLELGSEILYFHPKGLFGKAELIVRVRFVESGREIGDALVVVGSKAFRAGGANALADTAVSTLEKFLREGEKRDSDRDEGDDEEEDEDS